MAKNGLRDQNRLDEESNFVIRKARILFVVCAMSAHVPLQKKWGDIKLYSGGIQRMTSRILEVPNLLDYTSLWEPRRGVAGLVDVGRDR